MSLRRLASYPPTGSQIFLAYLALLLATILQATAQEPRRVVSGYVTAVYPNAEFDVNLRHVVTSPSTTYGLKGDKGTSPDSPLRDAVQIGAFVYVMGSFDKQTKTATAATVLLRDDLDQKLKGMGVIDKVISDGAEPVFRADGYEIRISRATKTVFHSGPTTLAEVGENAWIEYRGKRDKDGIVVASRAVFFASKTARPPAVRGAELVNYPLPPPNAGPQSTAPQKNAATESLSLEQPNFATHKDGRVKLRLIDGWHTIPADAGLQERIARIGYRLVPSYQMSLTAADRSKIRFRFAAIDDSSLRSDFCDHTGLILIPVQMVARLKNDDQVAAVLADGVAYNLQLQGARLLKENRILMAADATAAAAMVFVAPSFGITLLGANGLPASKNEILFTEQRGRVALALMQDAGYDPWQAPEAWRLLAPKRLPGDLNSIKYPNLSGYQLGILNLQY